MTPSRRDRRTWNEALSGSDPLLGTFLQFPSPQLVEVIGAAGFDFIVLDFEHGEYGISELANLQRAAELAGLWSVVRVASLDEATIGKALDFGANAVLVPHIETAEDARRAVAAARYPPKGKRGSYPFMRATGYRSRHHAGWEAEQNEETSVILLVEGRRGMENIEAIVQVPEVSAIFVGPVDLSLALGFPGQLRHPEVEAFAGRIADLATRAGLHAAIFCNDLEAAAHYAREGFRMIAYSVDAQFILNAYSNAERQFRGMLGQP